MTFRMLIFLAVAWTTLGLAEAFAAEKGNPWKASVSIGAEFNDNVNTSEIDDTSGTGDKALIVEVSGHYKIADTKAFGLDVGYDLYQSLYEDLPRFNLQTHTGSMFASGEVAGLDLSAYYGYSRALLGGDDFLGLHNFQPGVGLLVGNSWYVTASYNYQNKNFISFRDRDADAHAAAIDNFFFFNEQKSFVKLSYRLQNENARGSEFDFLGHYLTSEFNTPFKLFALRPKLKVSYQFYLKDYAHITPSIGRERLDRRHTGKASVQMPLNDNISLDVRLEYLRALSNLDSSDFVERVMGVSLKLSN